MEVSSSTNQSPGTSRQSLVHGFLILTETDDWRLATHSKLCSLDGYFPSRTSLAKLRTAERTVSPSVA